MARMAREYLPGSNLSRGKLYWPLASVTTLMVIDEPDRLALTNTPSIEPSSFDATLPVNAKADDGCAMTGPGISKPATNAVRTDACAPRILLVI